MRAHLRGQAEGAAGDDPPAHPAILPDRQVVAPMMGKSGVGLLVGLGQRHPGLNSVQIVALRPRLFKALGMGDAAPGHHPVDLAGPDRLLGPDAVAVHDLAGKDIGDGRQPDMRVGSHIDGARHAPWHVERAQMIEKHEWPDRPARGGRQDAPDVKPSEAAAALVDHCLDHQFLLAPAAS